MTISITNIVSLVNKVLWNRFMVATIFPAHGIGPDLYLQYVKDLTGGHLCNEYTDFSKLEMHDCKIAVVHM